MLIDDVSYKLNTHELVCFYLTTVVTEHMKMIVKDYLLPLRHTSDLTSSPPMRLSTPL